ncbi:protein adenylyltransferase SelO family protein [Synechococcus sp. AH-551-E05]|nr:protein adenylyltransferase SelO family protein [Synechococcus sp. AH-551-E05]MDB4651092.1 protein adenylyltransferase SelO family protein [Synechococcus sp. AH-551-E05]
MSSTEKQSSSSGINSFQEFIQYADYSLTTNLKSDPSSRLDGQDHRAREVFSGHFVPVNPTPLLDPAYIIHSSTLFEELGLQDALIDDPKFIKMFSGDLDQIDLAQSFGWATGYALSIYGTEYNQQCPFGTGNGYGDGRAISVFEGLFKGKRWEMQLKGGGPTPYCRGADGRAVLRSSVREFLVQEFMHALGIPTTRSLTLFVSQSQTVMRPWYAENSQSHDPDVLVENPIAITTRVASSFLRVGQLELFARRTRHQAHPDALEELKMIVLHLIEREYKDAIDQSLDFSDQLVLLARVFCDRLTSLVAHWLRVGYCQGNFNSDNCSAGGFTLDFGPFGFCELYDPQFQPWIGGGGHFAFLNQPVAAEANFHMFWKSIRLLLLNDPSNLEQLDQVRKNFEQYMQSKLHYMWSQKLGLPHYDSSVCDGLLHLLEISKIDYTIFFRELSHLPTDFFALKKSFYAPLSQQLEAQWLSWFDQWRQLIDHADDQRAVSRSMLKTNPKYTWREWLIAPAYELASRGDYSLIRELQAVLTHPYDEQTQEIEDQYYRLRPEVYFNAGGISHYSCSS